MAQSTFLQNLSSLFPFFRGTLVWLDIILMILNPISRTILDTVLFSFTNHALTFNVVVCIWQYNARNQVPNDNTSLPQSTIVILVDFFLTGSFIVLFVLEVDAFQSHWGEQGHDESKIIRVFVMIGTLAAWHYHLFFAVVSLQIWRMQRNVAPAASSGYVALATEADETALATTFRDTSPDADYHDAPLAIGDGGGLSAMESAGTDSGAASGKPRKEDEAEKLLD